MRTFKNPARLAAGLLLALAALRFAPHTPILSDYAWSRAVYASNGQLLRLALASDQQYRVWTPLEQISPQFVEAVLLYEDKTFYWHPGFNPYALLRSAQASASGPRNQGGSTLTMQLARRLYGIDSRTIPGKLLQIATAFWLELRYSKRDILEAYLNVAPYGGNIEGIGAASLIYFGKPPSRLSLPEAINLAVIPQNPRQRTLERAANTALSHARERLWLRWVNKHPEDVRLAADQHLRTQHLTRTALPFLAPHLTDMLLYAPPPQALDGTIRSSIDLRIQQTLERVLDEYLRTRADSGIRNASALLLDVQDMRVKALIGSADYHDENIAGQVNGVAAKRSPGSTLKPFIYGLALDQGVLHPMTLLRDAPAAFGTFSPENYDGRFVGPISAQDALIRSRNIPAVGVAARLSKPDLYDFLRMAGVAKLQTKEHYGLALVLGGGEITMEELAQLYAMLANGGVWQPLNYLAQGDKPAHAAQGTRLLSEEAAFVVLDMLRKTPRPDTELPARPAIAWKTGTSWGFRDAWTAGVFGRYVLVVWIGNFDGSGNHALIGIDAAAPLFLRMVDALRAQKLDPGELAMRQPPDLQKVQVCTASGDLADELCAARTETWFIAGKSPIRRSTLHRIVWVDTRTGQAYCGPAEHRQAKVYEYWPSNLRYLFSQAGLPRKEPPPLPDCAQESTPPQIVSPLRSNSYAIRINKPEPILLRADADSTVKTLFWFADDALVGHVAPGESLAWQPPLPRRYRVRVVDEAGRSDSRDLTVEFVP